MPQWKPEYDKPPFLKKFRILKRNFKLDNWVCIWPAKNKEEFLQTHRAFANIGLKAPRPYISFKTNMSFPSIKRFAWELSVFDAGHFFFNKIHRYQNLSSDYPSSDFIKRSSIITPSNIFFKRYKKIRSNINA